MEVHHHSHTARKKWTHYFWEFLMLFLAVFCGFLAEYQLEHVIEHNREKQFMKSIVEDLKADTAAIKRILSDIELRRNNIDSMLLLLTGDDISDDDARKSYSFSYPALNNLEVVFNDRTITQLKNAGNMRLIRNQKVNDGIIRYWAQIEIIRKAQERHLAYRTQGRSMENTFFNVAEIYLQNKGDIAHKTAKLILHDPVMFRQYANVIAACGIMLQSLHTHITEQNKRASGLIELIKTEYHF